MKIFKKFLGEHAPEPPRIIFVSLFPSNLAFPEKIRKNNVLKSSEHTPLAPSMDTFSKKDLAYIRSFSGLTSLHSVNIQFMIQNCIPPTKIFWIRSRLFCAVDGYISCKVSLSTSDDRVVSFRASEAEV